MTDRLNPGGRLFPGDALSSPNGRLILKMQDDGNLVLYASGNTPIWATGTNGRPGSILAMQEDGNLVVIAPGNVPVWSSRTFGQPECVLIIQDYGNLVIYAAGNRAVWSTDTRDPVEVITELFMAMTDDEFQNICIECGIQASAGGMFGGPEGAAGVVVGSPDCRKCVTESFRRTRDIIYEISHDEHEKREAKENFEKMDRENYELERYDHYRDTA